MELLLFEKKSTDKPGILFIRYKYMLSWEFETFFPIPPVFLNKRQT